MLEWRTATVAELQREGILLVEDGNHGEYRPRPDEFVDRGVAYIRAADMDDGRVMFDQAAKINDRARQRITKGVGAPGDVLLSHKGTVGKVSFVPDDSPSFVCSPQTTFWRTLDSRVLDSKYIYAFLRSPGFQGQLATVAGETDMAPYVSLTSQRALSVLLPPILEQHAIARIVGTLDDKIDLNHQINRTLETIAKLIFKHWFMDFEFLNDEGKPYKSSGGEMADSEVGIVPKGWGVLSLDHVAEFTRGFSYNGSEKSRHHGQYVFVTLNSVKEGGGFKREFSYVTSSRIKERHFVSRGEIVLANTEQTKTGTLLGYPALVEFPFEYDKDKGVISHHITKVVTKSKDLKDYFYYYLLAHQQNAVKYNTGSVIWALDVNNWARNEKVVLPPERLIRQFELLMDNLFTKSAENNLQIETLSRLRDSLLPKLMSGKIRVPVEVR